VTQSVGHCAWLSLENAERVEDDAYLSRHPAKAGMQNARQWVVVRIPGFCRNDEKPVQCFKMPFESRRTKRMHTQAMLATHPNPAQRGQAELVACIDACYDCAQSCTACADACLAESEVQTLLRCIRLNRDCATVCLATGEILSRQTERDWDLARQQLGVCAQACRMCAEECEKHAERHEHCRVCAESCRQCEGACDQLTAGLPD
jgi:hypothetical protein